VSTDYAPGDHVLIRGEVLEFIDGVGACVELFSKTDQYRAWVRADLIQSKTKPPRIPEPGLWSTVSSSSTTGARFNAVRWDLGDDPHHWVDISGNWMSWDQLVEPKIVSEGLS